MRISKWYLLFQAIYYLNYYSVHLENKWAYALHHYKREIDKSMRLSMEFLKT